MNTGPEKIKNFTDLRTWRLGHSFVLKIYKTTSNFPKEEQLGLISQMRRAAVSFTSNIAEGFGRNSAKEKSRFYAIAFGSLKEVENQLLIARDLGFVHIKEFKEFEKIITELSKMISGLMKTTSSKN